MTGLTERTIRNYLKNGKLQGKQIGAQWRFTEDDIKRLFEDVTVTNNVAQNNHDRVFEFLKHDPKPDTGAVVINVPVVAENELEAKVQGDDYTYVYVIKDTLNWYLDYDGNSTEYKYTYVSSYTNEYKDLVLTNILNNHPVQPNLKISSTTYFPYTTNGHYVVIKGMTYSSSDGYYTAVINDPHDDYCDTYYVPVSTILDYTQAHFSGGYLIHVDD